MASGLKGRGYKQPAPVRKKRPSSGGHPGQGAPGPSGTGKKGSPIGTYKSPTPSVAKQRSAATRTELSRSFSTDRNRRGKRQAQARKDIARVNRATDYVRQILGRRKPDKPGHSAVKPYSHKRMVNELERDVRKTAAARRRGKVIARGRDFMRPEANADQIVREARKSLAAIQKKGPANVPKPYRALLGVDAAGRRRPKPIKPKIRHVDGSGKGRVGQKGRGRAQRQGPRDRNEGRETYRVGRKLFRSYRDKHGRLVSSFEQGDAYRRRRRHVKAIRGRTYLEQADAQRRAEIEATRADIRAGREVNLKRSRRRAARTVERKARRKGRKYAVRQRKRDIETIARYGTYAGSPRVKEAEARERRKQDRADEKRGFGANLVRDVKDVVTGAPASIKQTAEAYAEVAAHPKLIFASKKRRGRTKLGKLGAEFLHGSPVTAIVSGKGLGEARRRLVRHPLAGAGDAALVSVGANRVLRLGSSKRTARAPVRRASSTDVRKPGRPTAQKNVRERRGGARQRERAANRGRETAAVGPRTQKPRSYPRSVIARQVVKGYEGAQARRGVDTTVMSARATRRSLKKGAQRKRDSASAADLRREIGSATKAQKALRRLPGAARKRALKFLASGIVRPESVLADLKVVLPKLERKLGKGHPDVQFLRRELESEVARPGSSTFHKKGVRRARQTALELDARAGERVVKMGVGTRAQLDYRATAQRGVAHGEFLSAVRGGSGGKPSKKEVEIGLKQAQLRSRREKLAQESQVIAKTAIKQSQRNRASVQAGDETVSAKTRQLVRSAEHNADRAAAEVAGHRKRIQRGREQGLDDSVLGPAYERQRQLEAKEARAQRTLRAAYEREAAERGPVGSGGAVTTRGKQGELTATDPVARQKVVIPGVKGEAPNIRGRQGTRHAAAKAKLDLAGRADRERRQREIAEELAQIDAENKALGVELARARKEGGPPSEPRSAAKVRAETVAAQRVRAVRPTEAVEARTRTRIKDLRRAAQEAARKGDARKERQLTKDADELEAQLEGMVARPARVEETQQLTSPAVRPQATQRVPRPAPGPPRAPREPSGPPVPPEGQGPSLVGRDGPFRPPEGPLDVMGVRYKDLEAERPEEPGMRTLRTGWAGQDIFDMDADPERVFKTIAKQEAEVSQAHVFQELVEYGGRGIMKDSDADAFIKQERHSGVEWEKHKVHPELAQRLEANGRGRLVEDVDGDTVVLPKAVGDEWRKHLKLRGPVQEMGRVVTRQFLRATLPLSPLWQAGNLADVTTRAMVGGGFGPHWNRAYKEFIGTIRARDPELAAQLESLMQGHFGSRSAVLKGPRLSDVFEKNRPALAARLRKLGETPIINGPRKAIGYPIDKAFDAGAAAEGVVIRGIMGKVAYNQARELGISQKEHVRLAQRMLDDPALVEQFQAKTLELVGDYTKSTAGRALSPLDPFWSWFKAANKFVFLTLPKKHPIKAAMIAAAVTMSERERRRLGLSYYLNNEELVGGGWKAHQEGFLAGGLPGSTGYVPTSPFTSLGEAAKLLPDLDRKGLDQFKPVVAALAGRLLPFAQAPVTAPFGLSRWQGAGDALAEWSVGGNDWKGMTRKQQRLNGALSNLASAFLPGARQLHDMRLEGRMPNQGSTPWGPDAIDRGPRARGLKALDPFRGREGFPPSIKAKPPKKIPAERIEHHRDGTSVIEDNRGNRTVVGPGGELIGVRTRKGKKAAVAPRKAEVKAQAITQSGGWGSNTGGGEIPDGPAPSIADIIASGGGPVSGAPVEVELVGNKSFQGGLANEAAERFGVPAPVLMGLIDVESGGNPNAVSSAGARGLTQFMPGTAPGYGVKYGATKSAQRSQVFGAARYLVDLGWHKNQRLALASYNAGPGNPGAAGDYPEKVLAAARNHGAGKKVAVGATRGRIPGGRSLQVDPRSSLMVPSESLAPERFQVARRFLQGRISPVDFASEIAQLQDPAGQMVELGGKQMELSGPGVPKNAHQALRKLVGEAARIDGMRRPYLWGGGHGATPSRSGPWDCSGAISALLGVSPRVSGQFMNFGQAGEGKYLTIYASPTHVLARIGDRFWGTSGSNPGGGAGWIPASQVSSSYLSGFAKRHIKGL